MNIKDGKNIIQIAIILLSLDAFYFWINANYLTKLIENVQHSKLKLRYMPIIICYGYLIFAEWYFILREHKSPLDAFLLGIIIYGVYESTNYASFINWNYQTFLMDTLWGGILMATTTWIMQLHM